MDMIPNVEEPSSTANSNMLSKIILIVRDTIRGTNNDDNALPIPGTENFEQKIPIEERSRRKDSPKVLNQESATFRGEILSSQSQAKPSFKKYMQSSDKKNKRC